MLIFLSWICSHSVVLCATVGCWHYQYSGRESNKMSNFRIAISTCCSFSCMQSRCKAWGMVTSSVLLGGLSLEWSLPECDKTMLRNTVSSGGSGSLLIEMARNSHWLVHFQQSQRQCYTVPHGPLLLCSVLWHTASPPLCPLGGSHIRWSSSAVVLATCTTAILPSTRVVSCSHCSDVAGNVAMYHRKETQNKSWCSGSLQIQLSVQL